MNKLSDSCRENVVIAGVAGVVLCLVAEAPLQAAYGPGDESLVPTRVVPTPRELDDHHNLRVACPGITATKGGRLWATWCAGGKHEDERNAMVVATSADGGDTWTKPIFAVSAPGHVRVTDPGIWTDPDGKVWLLWGQLYGVWDGRCGLWVSHPIDPDDPATEWTEPRRLCDGYMKNKPLVRANGDWLFPCEFYYWNFGAMGDISAKTPMDPLYFHPVPESWWGATVFRSTDKGASFSYLGTCFTPKEMRNCPEEMVVEKKDGRLWMLVRVNQGIAESFSSDGGKTWSSLTLSRIPSPAARFHISRLASGNLLLVKNGPMTNRTGRVQMTAFLSEDDGETWSDGLLLDPRGAVSYPDACQDAAGVIHVMHDRARNTEKEILYHRFTEDDLRAGKIVSAVGRLGLLANHPDPEAMWDGEGTPKAPTETLPATAVRTDLGASDASWEDCAVVADGARVIAAWSARSSDGRLVVRGRVSSDGGKTWGEESPFAADPALSVGLPAFAADGKNLWLFSARMSGDRTPQDVLVARFDPAKGAFVSAAVLPQPFLPNGAAVRLTDGRFALPGRAVTSEKGRQVPAVLVSASGRIDGVWKRREIAPWRYWRDTTFASPETTLLREDDGCLVAFVRPGREDKGRTARPLAYRSSDETVNWDGPIFHNLPILGIKATAGNLSDGRRYVIANEGKSRTRLTLYLAEPGARAFTRRILLCDGPSQYASAWESDGKLHVVYTAGGNEHRCVYLAFGLGDTRL